MSLRIAQVVLLSLLVMLWPGLTDASPVADTSPLVPMDVLVCKLPAQSFAFSVGFSNNAFCMHSVGTVTAFVLFVDFPDSPSADTSGQQQYDMLFPDAANWFKHVSYGRLSLEVTSDTRFYRMASSLKSWGWAGQAPPPETVPNYIQEAIQAYHKANGQRIPTVDVLLILPPTSAAEMRASVTYGLPVRRSDGSPIAKKTIVLGPDINYLLLNHEMGHIFCLPDLYPFPDGAEYNVYKDYGRFVGGFSLMANEAVASPDLFAWDKWRLGWISDNGIDCLDVRDKGSSRHRLTPLYRNMLGKKAVVLVLSKETALVAEYRLDGGVDTATCSPGLLLYTIDTRVRTGRGPIRVIDAHPWTTGCDDQPLNDATLSINGKKSLRIHEYGVDVEIVSQSFTHIVFDVKHYR